MIFWIKQPKNIIDKFNNVNDNIIGALKLILPSDIIDILLDFLSNIQISQCGISDKLLSNKYNYLLNYNFTNEDDNYWKDIVKNDFGHLLVKTNQKGNFETWKQYANYLCYMFQDNKFRDHNLDIIYLGKDNDYITKFDVEKHIEEKTESSIYRRCDLVDCTDFDYINTHDGRRYVNYFSIDIDNQNQIQVLIEKRNVETTTIPNSFKIIQEFPITYWGLGKSSKRIDDVHNPLLGLDNDHNSILGLDNRYVYTNNFFNSFGHEKLFWYPNEMGINLTSETIKEIRINNELFRYCVFTHQNINYCIYFPNYKGIDPNSHFIEVTSFANPELRIYDLFIEYILIIYKVTWRQCFQQL